MSSTPDQFFSDTIVRFQQWLQFLEHKANEYQTQLNRVQRKQPAADAAEPTAAAPAAEPAPAPGEDPWQ